VLGHSVETGYQDVPSFSTFHLVHLPGELLFDSLAQSYMVRIDDIPQEVDTFGYREHPFVGLHLETYLFHLSVNDIPYLPQFRLRLTKHETIIAIAVEVTDSVAILQIMVQELNKGNNKWQTGELEYPLGRGINFEIDIDNIDGMYNSLKNANYELFVDIEEHWYRKDNVLLGNKEFLVKDPNGYLLRFSEELPSKEI